MPDLQVFVGRPVQAYDAEVGLSDPQGVAPRVGGYVEVEPPPVPEGAGLLRRFTHRLGNLFAPSQELRAAEVELSLLTADPRLAELEALVVGMWNDPAEVVRLLLQDAARLTGLRHLYLGDVAQDELEMSWIAQADVTPLLRSFPMLETLHLRGEGVGWEAGVRHTSLRDLQVECISTTQDFVAAVLSAELPALERLELWLGDAELLNEPAITPDQLRPLLSGKLFPNLRHLGLRNSSEADALADALASAPLLGQLRGLDLSLGTLGDEGAAALLACPGVRELERLDLRGHYIEDGDLLNALRALPLEVREEPSYFSGDDVRYCAVTE